MKYIEQKLFLKLEIKKETKFIETGCGNRRVKSHVHGVDKVSSVYKYEYI